MTRLLNDEPGHPKEQKQSIPGLSKVQVLSWHSITFSTFCWLKQVTGQPTFTVLIRFSRVRLFVTPWTVARQAPLSMGFSRQEYWSGLPYLLPRDLPNPGMEPASLRSPHLAGGFFTTSTTWETLITEYGSVQFSRSVVSDSL